MKEAAFQAYRAGAPHDPDQRVVIHGLDWWRFEAMLAIRGDRSGVRLAYLEGDLEITSPSRTHEAIKKTIARLLEAYAEERGIFFNGYGSGTMKKPSADRAVEPDECYVVGSDKETPDLAIEVIWTSRGIDKRSIYAAFGVRELWEWEDGRLVVLILHGQAYVPAPRSELIPELDLAVLDRFVAYEDQTSAVREFRKLLRG